MGSASAVAHGLHRFPTLRESSASFALETLSISNISSLVLVNYGLVSAKLWRIRFSILSLP